MQYDDAYLLEIFIGTNLVGKSLFFELNL